MYICLHNWNEITVALGLLPGPPLCFRDFTTCISIGFDSNYVTSFTTLERILWSSIFLECILILFSSCPFTNIKWENKMFHIWSDSIFDLDFGASISVSWALILFVHRKDWWQLCVRLHLLSVLIIGVPYNENKNSLVLNGISPCVVCFYVFCFFF